jgi:hypothetical protein
MIPMPYDGDIKRLAPLPSSCESYCHRCSGTLAPEFEFTCVCGHLPYKELHYLAPGADGGWQQMCNVCGFDTSVGQCPLHAPHDIPGLDRVECRTVPPHEPTWTVASEARYENWCPWCLLDQERERHPEPDAHEGHGRWRSWRITMRMVRVLEVTRLSTGHTFRVGGGCTGCVHRVGWRWVR